MLPDEKTLISVIIPVYNGSQYLGRCIQTVIDQTYTNLEIILIDDGSTDNSGKMCDKYALKDKRIKVIHKENEGVSSARNLALDIVTGEYISFIDADDYVDKGFIEHLFQAMVDYNADLSICAYEKIGGIDLTGRKQVSLYTNEKFFIQIDGLLDKNLVWFHSIDSNQIGCYLWNKLFKRSLLRGARFDERLSIGEDMVYLAEYVLKCEKIVYVKKDMYKYIMNHNSAMNEIGCRNAEQRQKSIEKMESALKAAKILQQLTKNENAQIKKYVGYRQVRSSLWIMFHMILNHSFEPGLSVEIRKTVRENYRYYRAVKIGSRVQHVAAFFVKFVPQMLYFVGIFLLWMFPKKMYKMSRM